MKKFFAEVVRRLRVFYELDVMTYAGALAFSTLLGVIPAITLLFWYLKSISVTDKWIDLARNFILEQLTVSSSEAFLKAFNHITKEAGGASWGWVGLILFLYTTYSLIMRFGDTLDIILKSRATPEREVDLFSVGKLVIRRLLAMLLLPLSLVISLSLTQWLRHDSWLHHVLVLPTIGGIVAIPLAWATNISSLFVIYHFVPRARVPWKDALKAALVITPVLELSRYGFGVYGQYAVATHKIYGVFAVIPLFMIWIQLGWTILLCGAFLMNGGSHRRGKKNYGNT